MVVNAEWYFWSHRLPIARALLARGCDVAVAAAEERGMGGRIDAEGIRFIPLTLHRRSTGLLRDLRTAVHLWHQLAAFSGARVWEQAVTGYSSPATAVARTSHGRGRSPS